MITLIWQNNLEAKDLNWIIINDKIDY